MSPSVAPPMLAMGSAAVVVVATDSAAAGFSGTEGTRTTELRQKKITKEK